jgi:seryl-tRNA synthetase
MLDIQLLRNDPAAVAARLKTRGYVLDVARFESTEARRKSVQTRTQELQARRNAVSKEIGAAKGRGQDPKALMAEVAGLGDELKTLAAELSDIQSDLREWLLAVPNLPHASVPIGASEAQNVELRRVGSPRAFGFEARDHVDVGAAVGGIEFDVSAKLSGSRFHTLRGNVARLHRALTVDARPPLGRAWLLGAMRRHEIARR